MGPLTSPLVARSARSPLSLARDVVALSKPRITLMVMLTALGGAWLAPVRVEGGAMVWLVLGTALVVGGANALNMLLERDTDGLMERTRNRPLPAGRLSPRTVLWFGLIASGSSIPILGFGVNATTATLALLANLLYVLAYTPLKRRSHLALLVGAVPGALPPLMGWTAATASVDAGGLVLFAILYFWQLPHFMAIALFRKDEYERARLVVMPSVR
ncbi:MAG TPA: heme o synthase, partial [Polyangiaceae bacterium]|nr:heme o synthase [Polyangiaceae bacterium]